MAWTAGVTRTTGDLITAAQWNSYLGAAGSLDYLKTETDKLDDCSLSNPANALDTIYQNSTKIRIVTVSLQLDTPEGVTVKIGSGTPPATVVADAKYSDTGGLSVTPVTFVVPPSWYYKVEVTTATPTIWEWAEWDLH